MIRHIVAWNFNDTFSESENCTNSVKIKEKLEKLKNIIPGIAELQVKIDLLPASTHNIVLLSLFESQAALDNYQKHPEHLKVGAFIKGVCHNRICIDYEE